MTQWTEYILAKRLIDSDMINLVNCSIETRQLNECRNIFFRYTKMASQKFFFFFYKCAFFTHSLSRIITRMWLVGFFSATARAQGVRQDYACASRWSNAPETEMCEMQNGLGSFFATGAVRFERTCCAGRGLTKRKSRKMFWIFRIVSAHNGAQSRDIYDMCHRKGAHCLMRGVKTGLIMQPSSVGFKFVCFFLRDTQMVVLIDAFSSGPIYVMYSIGKSRLYLLHLHPNVGILLVLDFSHWFF